MHVIKLLMHNIFIYFCLSIGRIKHNEKDIQAKMKMCTGADVFSCPLLQQEAEYRRWVSLGIS